MTTAGALPILVVEDDDANRLLLTTFLKAAGYATLEAASGEDALAILAREHVSVVLLDVVLPGLSGFEVCQRIKQDHRTATIPVIMVTASDDSSSRTRAFDSDADEFLAKPVFRAELLARVRSILRLRDIQLEKEAAQLALEAEKRDRLQSLFERYLSKTVAEHVLALPDNERAALLSQEQRTNCAVMFTDVRNFTAMSDVLEPSEVVGILNEHFNTLTGIVHRHSGTIFNMTGDGLLIGFGLPLPHEAPCEQAVAAAVDMHRDSQALLERVRQRHGIRIGLGIGINYGPVIMGNVGSASFQSFTIIGDTVNVAARAQSLADGGNFIITGSVWDAMGSRVDGLPWTELSGISLKGKTAPQMLYRIAAT